MPPDLIQACTTFGYGPDMEVVSVVPVECSRTGGMIYQVIERSLEGDTYLRKMAVVIFHPRDEGLFPQTAARQVAGICGKCIQRQLTESNEPESNEPGLLVDLTKVAICMTDLASKPQALGKVGEGYQGGEPRGGSLVRLESS